ncbi:MAG: GTPase [candidate division Zixibacteria bacterium]|nr:GTPase [candidate division Zixibacteria bacterium]NIR67849.1 GTPase [candidate division Zixibacteria bacterium]NIS15545.1 GTPase [candidate division Zixibacteria bacterium]NIS49075.1 GTPase [candidate division Zixibacteria bacterium]NIT52070.1 GTPase [candidate division Zixibacteria bacterium]
MTKNVIIMGAAGRDFHNFNTFYRDNKSYKVVAFTATQIPNIEGRKYPAKLAGKLYPKGIPILPEEDLENLILKHKVDEVVFSYSDVPQQHVMHAAAVVDRAGASFVLLGSKETMIKSKKPVIAITAIRTGCGKSQTTRKVCAVLKEIGKQPVAIRHPMPYGDLSKQISQRFAKLSDLKKHNCTIEEMEEYEPHIKAGTVCYAGVDYAEILKNAEKEADVIVWDGGNNDTPFYKPDLWIVVTDPHRAGHELTYFPGFTNFISADVIVMNKMETADPQDIAELRENISIYNPYATVIEGASPVFVDDPEVIQGKSVLVVEDGPTLTHGEMQYGAGIVAAQKFGAIDFVDPRPYLKGTLKGTFEKYPNIGPLLPAMGYGDQQIKDLSATINATRCDSVVIATPIDLRRIIDIKKPSTRVRYELQEIGAPDMTMVISEFFKKKK